MERPLGSVLDIVIFGNSILRYLVAGLIFAGGMLVVKMVIRKFIQRLKRFSLKTSSTLDDFLVGLLEGILLPLLYLVVVYLGLRSLTLPSILQRLLNYIILGVSVFFVVKVLIAFIDYGLKVYLKKRSQDATLAKSLQGLMVVVRVVVWLGAVIFFLDNLGFKITAVITGLGIGGVAVALAAQTILKDLFSYFCIIFDRPFKVGDFIIVGDFMGTIESIGIKSTRLRSLGGEILILSNSDLTDSRLRNFQLMERRRVVFKIGVEYQTSLEQLKVIPKIIEDIISNINDAIFERAHFASFGDFAIIFEVVYWVVGSDYKKYMDIQQRINLAVMEEFSRRKIQFAYPTQTIYLKPDTN